MSDQTDRTLATRTRADPDLKREQFLDTFRAGNPGFEATPPGVVWSLADAVGELAADLEQTALVDEVRRYFRELGRRIFRLAPIDAAPGTGTSTWFLAGVPATGAVIEAGTPVRAGDVNFEVLEDVPVAAGQTEATVVIRATEDGAALNGLTGPLQILAAISFVNAATLNGPTSGGVDAETDEAYEQRFAERLQHIGRPTLPADFADRLRSLPSVYRVLALDNYVPANGPTPAQTNVAKAITLVPVDEQGEAVAPDVRAAGAALLLAEREPNWLVAVIPPTYTTVAVTATVTLWPGYDQADVKARAEAALAAFLSPGTWGAPPDGEKPVWHDEPVVLRSEVSARLNEVQGVRHVLIPRINGADADLPLAAPAGLPRPGVITVTVA